MLKSHLKKTIFLLIISFLLQMNWSLAKVYCMHESGSAAQHVGHHEHQHTSAFSVGDESDVEQKTVQFHADCASCVSVLTLAIIMDSTKISTSPVTHANSLSPFKIPTPWLALPERPQWLIAA